MGRQKDYQWQEKAAEKAVRQECERRYTVDRTLWQTGGWAWVALADRRIGMGGTSRQEDGHG